MADDATTTRIGRPPGSGPVAKLRRALLTNGQLDALVAKVYEKAAAGDLAATRLLLERVMPPLRAHAQPMKIDLPDGPLIEQSKAVIQAMAAGLVPVDVGSELVGTILKVLGGEQVEDLRTQLNAMTFGDIA